MKSILLYSTIFYILAFNVILGQNTYTYTLIDADNNTTAISSFNTDVTWNIDNSGGLNLISDLSVYGVADKVRFITSENTRTEGAIPYAYYGDAFGSYGQQGPTYYGWFPTVGSLFFTVEYLDANLNVITTDTFTITFIDNNTSSPDTQAPTAPTLSSTGETETTADFSWSGATDNVGITGYKVFKDASLEATLGNVSTYQVTGLTASTTYSFTVTALDATGNESTASNAVSVTTNASSGGGGGSSAWSESGTTLSHTGEVAIGTSGVPSGYKLAVDGHIRTREIRVDQDSWPDYVFEEDYELPSLEEIQKHIEEKGHLPNIPSAREVEANGIEVGEMNKLFLEKIEELTLYIIDLEARQERLENQNSDLISTLENVERLGKRIKLLEKQNTY